MQHWFVCSAECPTLINDAFSNCHHLSIEYDMFYSSFYKTSLCELCHKLLMLGLLLYLNVLLDALRQCMHSFPFILEYILSICTVLNMHTTVCLYTKPHTIMRAPKNCIDQINCNSNNRSSINYTSNIIIKTTPKGPFFLKLLLSFPIGKRSKQDAGQYHSYYNHSSRVWWTCWGDYWGGPC